MEGGAAKLGNKMEEAEEDAAEIDDDVVGKVADAEGEEVMIAETDEEDGQVSLSPDDRRVEDDAHSRETLSPREEEAEDDGAEAAEDDAADEMDDDVEDMADEEGEEVVTAVGTKEAAQDKAADDGGKGSAGTESSYTPLAPSKPDSHFPVPSQVKGGADAGCPGRVHEHPMRRPEVQFLS